MQSEQNKQHLNFYDFAVRCLPWTLLLLCAVFVGLLMYCTTSEKTVCPVPSSIEYGSVIQYDNHIVRGATAVHIVKDTFKTYPDMTITVDNGYTATSYAEYLPQMINSHNPDYYIVPSDTYSIQIVRDANDCVVGLEMQKIL